MVDASVPMVFTIGHSNHSLDHFVSLLTSHGLDVVVDTRSYPFSRFAPQFNRDSLERVLPGAGVRYAFRGRELGGRPDGDQYYDEDGHVLYWRVAESASFVARVTALRDSLDRLRVALLCSEENPKDCHRRLLIGRVLASHGIQVLHIRGTGAIEVEQEFRPVSELHQATGQLRLMEDPSRVNLTWKSVRSVSRRSRPASSSIPSAEPVSVNSSMSG
jgi:uncharacterized protein (DUF488 family)